MDTVPVKNGQNCVFRVVRVSGTIRKAESEAIRSAREMILRARHEIGDRTSATLDNIFGKVNCQQEAHAEADIIMLDGTDSEDEDSNGDG